MRIRGALAGALSRSLPHRSRIIMPRHGRRIIIFAPRRAPLLLRYDLDIQRIQISKCTRRGRKPLKWLKRELKVRRRRPRERERERGKRKIFVREAEELCAPRMKSLKLSRLPCMEKCTYGLRSPPSLALSLAAPLPYTSPSDFRSFLDKDTRFSITICYQAWKVVSLSSTALFSVPFFPGFFFHCFSNNFTDSVMLMEFASWNGYATSNL